MKNTEWEAVHAGHETQKDAHHMKMPNGEDYPGGWTAHGRSPKKAKESFHENQVKWQVAFTL